MNNKSTSNIAPALASGLCILLAACGGKGSTEPLPVSNDLGPAPFDPGEPYEPKVSASDLSTTVSNSLFPVPTGARWVYEAVTDEGLERIIVAAEGETREVWGVTVTVVRDTVTLDGELIEDTWDWYAQDLTGHVWYLGEDTFEYENGIVVCSCGAWETGMDNAQPGVVMLANPKVGDVYRQEFLKDEAEDLAEVLAVNETVTVAAGTFTGCTKTLDLSAIESDVQEFKYYCPGVGNVLVEEGDVRVELIGYSGL